MPLASITEFWIFENEFSIFSLFSTLISSGEILLAVIVFGFGFLFPLAKITTSFFEGLGSIPANIQRFSMVDVFLLSFLVYGSTNKNSRMYICRCSECKSIVTAQYGVWDEEEHQGARDTLAQFVLGSSRRPKMQVALRQLT